MKHVAHLPRIPGFDLGLRRTKQVVIGLLPARLAGADRDTDAPDHPDQIDRILTTVLVTDIVASTEQVAAVGDRRWRFGGKEINTTGDGFLASFDGPARAIRCPQAITSTTAGLGIELRAGLHTGECEVRGNNSPGSQFTSRHASEHSPHLERSWSPTP